jgi:hypothetical protein
MKAIIQRLVDKEYNNYLEGNKPIWCIYYP